MKTPGGRAGATLHAVGAEEKGRESTYEYVGEFFCSSSNQIACRGVTEITLGTVTFQCLIRTLATSPPLDLSIIRGNVYAYVVV